MTDSEDDQSSSRQTPEKTDNKDDQKAAVDTDRWTPFGVTSHARWRRQESVNG